MLMPQQRIDDVMGCFYEEMERVLDKFPGRLTNFLLRSGVRSDDHRIIKKCQRLLQRI
jgi:hypothetical protein